jgi:formylglycine-generating enzyme required for sulfatase activity
MRFLLPLLALPLSVFAGEWVTIGDPGNPADKNGFGSVAQVYQIMKHEVTCAEYVAFLNAKAQADPNGLWHQKMDGAPLPPGRDDIRSEQGCLIRTGEAGQYRYAVAPGREHIPIVNVSFANAMRYTNWKHGGETETGAYDIATLRAMATRRPEAKVWLPSEDEWHKAAYYDAGAKRYWLYATRSDERPQSRPPDTTAPNAANFFWNEPAGTGMNKGHAVTQSDGYRPGSITLTPVGSYPLSLSAYGTLDQSGNVWEWTEGIAWETKRVLRGGSWFDEANALRSTTRSNALPTAVFHDTGFRLCRPAP